MSDSELMSAFISTGSEEAFSELIRRPTGLGYAGCLRVLDDKDRAAGAGPAPFMVLLQRGRTLARNAIPAAWLYRVAELAARNVRRGQQRAARRAQEAAAMPRPAMTPEENLWPELKPKLDAVLAALPAFQRDVI